MLSSRTKQIKSYGKRTKRVVDASPSTQTPVAVSTTEILSIFENMPAPPPWKGVAARMKKRENEIPKSKARSPVVVVGLQKKKRLSPVLSPFRKNKFTKLVLFDSPAPTANPIAKSNQTTFSASPSRAPFSSVALNIQGSPALMQKLRIPSTKRPLTLQKPLTPFVDVDIIVLDNEGHTISKEKRVSRTNVATHSKSKIPMSRKSIGKPSVLNVQSDSEEETQTLRRPKHQSARRNLIASSEDEDSDHEHVPQAPSTKLNKPSRPSKLSRTNTIVEVWSPPAPAVISQQTTTKENSTPSPIAYTALPEIASPVLRPRQLTPIRGSRKQLFQPPSPPSPTVTDLDLTIDFSDLNLDDTSFGTIYDFQIPEYLKPLLVECHQDACGPHNFSAFIESFPYDPILQSGREVNLHGMKFRKIGEASYSEVFGIGDVVLKIIPLLDESNTTEMEEAEGPAPTDAKDVRKEIIVTRAMGEVYGGFIKLLKTYVVKGRYPEVLLRLWDEYNERKGSESVRPDTFKVSQMYAIIVLPNGGPDLEAYTFHNASRSGWRQACSLFWQVAKSLAHAEHLVSFEHRDLHWGQILVKNLPTQASALKSLNANQRLKPKLERVYMDDRSHGIQATIIDLGLSRMDAGDGTDGERVHWTPFDEEVFMGEGDYQFDVYRVMKELTGGSWVGFHPITNVLWLHYLLRKLLQSKGLKPPVIPRKVKVSEDPAPPTREGAFNEKDCYDCLVDIENWLGKAVAELIPGGGKLLKGGKSRRKTQAPLKTSVASSGPARAGEIVAYGVKKGWIQPSTMF